MNIRRWRAAARFFVLFVGLAIAALLVIFTADAFNLVLTPLGWWNLAAFEALLGWYAFDELFTRRERALWRKSVESPIGTGLRFWRKIVFLALTIVTLGAALIALTEHSARERDLLAAGQFVVPEKSLSYIATLASVFIAAFGWMYTTFERDRADRSAATVKAVNDQLYSDHPSTVYQEVLALTLHVRKLRAIDASVALPLEAMGTRLSHNRHGSASAIDPARLHVLELYRRRYGCRAEERVPPQIKKSEMGAFSLACGHAREPGTKRGQRI